MWNPGKIVIVVLLGVGLAAALFSLWYQRQGGRRALEFWGAQTALLVARAPRIEALQLRPAAAAKAGDNGVGEAPLASDEPLRRIGVGGRFYLVSDGKDASGAPGISNIRRAMVIDSPYQWDETGAADPTWQYALEFREGEQAAIVLFDFDSGQISSASGAATAVLRPAAVADWRSFFAEQFERGSVD